MGPPAQLDDICCCPFDISSDIKENLVQQRMLPALVIPIYLVLKYQFQKHIQLFDLKEHFACSQSGDWRKIFIDFQRIVSAVVCYFQSY